MTLTRARDIRSAFLGYFEKHGHAVVKSSPLVPHGDPTLMFTNAGMVQFKDVFVGKEKRPYSRAVSCQKCLRVSGKHNDLEEVGRTTRHHTFFEMLGNFSFGDYFKEEAIVRAWEFSTREMGLDRGRMWVTVFEGAPGLPADDEARALWKKVSGLPDERILALGMKDNFWAMGDTGPCGPCTEIHFDTGKGAVTPADFQNGRVIEFWNNVFMQFERTEGGQLVPLPKPSVDTGMGLERLCTLLNGADSNYHTDLFLPLIEETARLAGKSYARSPSEDDVSMRVIADHARTTAFLTADGVQPSNEGRGYVMRRIMRRAIRHGKRLGLSELFFFRVCDLVVESMGTAYPELVEARSLITKVAELEERSFRRTLDTGLRLLEDELAGAQRQGARTVSGAAVFRLYDTYGFPRDLTELIASERGLGIDEAGFEREMAAQQERSRGSEVGSAAVGEVYKALLNRVGATEFAGYVHEDEPLAKRPGLWRQRQHEGRELLELQTRIAALVQAGAEVTQASAGEVELVLTASPFYGESGGQIGDQGILTSDSGLIATVGDSRKPAEGLIVSRARIERGTVSVGQTVWAGYEPAVRKQTRAHHSATHLLHGALRGVLGEHVKQAGSLVDPSHLRFDYSHFEQPTPEQLRRVEDEANALVTSNHEVVTDVLPFDEAKQKGAIALFGEKYGDVVRVVSMGPSIEFCGGTHAKRTGDIGLVLITREEAVAAGVRRMEAEVGEAARRTVRSTHARLVAAADILSGRAAPEADKLEPILLAVAKAVRTSRELAEALRGAGLEPTVVDTHAVQPPPLSTAFGLTEARATRDLWLAMVQLANARGPEADQIVQRVRAIDAGGVAAAFCAVAAANRDNERKREGLKRSQLAARSGDLATQASVINGVVLLATTVAGADGKALREVADDLRGKLPSGIVCLGADFEGKAALLVAVSKDLTARFKAGELIAKLAPLVGGRGGGKPDLAQAGGTNPAGLVAAYAALRDFVAGA